MDDIRNLTLDSSNEEILKIAQGHASGSPNIGHEMKLSYCLNLLIAKQYKQLVSEQNSFNKKQVGWTIGLVIGTWILALITLIR